MRVLFFGNGRAAIRCLDWLKNTTFVSDIMVVTPFMGKFHEWHESLGDYSRKNKIKILKAKNVNSHSIFKRFASYKPDVILSVYYTQILSESILKLVTHAINFHPSLLPKYRGTAPLIWAIVNGEQVTGVTAHEMTKKVDFGKIISQLSFPISSKDTGYTLHNKAAKVCQRVFRQVVQDLHDGKITYFANNKPGSYFSSKDKQVNLLKPDSQTKIEIYNIVRALAKPLPMAYLDYSSRRYYLNRVSMISNGSYTNKLQQIQRNDKIPFHKFHGRDYLLVKDGFLRIIQYEKA